MIEIFTLVISILAIALAIPVLFLAVQMIAALLPGETSAPASPLQAPGVAVVIPAHNEEANISRTITSIMSGLPRTVRLLVVADNCTDNTAQTAFQCGAEVIIRQDATRIGKGYALDHAVRALSAAPPHVVLFIDADCEIDSNSLDILAMRCAATGRPVQARYSMLASSAGAADKISQFAWTVKTLVRPSGAARLGWPCQLMGSGMAVPFETIRRIDLANGHLAEDQKLGAELALKDALPVFCPQAHVISRFPSSERAKHQQRTRWEHGHLAIIGEFFPALIGYAISRRSFQLFAFALDLCIPPLSLLVLSLALAESMALAWFAVAGSAAPLVICSFALACLSVSIGAVWWRFGRELISLRELAAMPGYCLAKISSFIRFFVNRQIDWVRTER